MVRRYKMSEEKDYLKEEIEQTELLYEGKPVTLKSPGSDSIADFFILGRDMAKSKKEDDAGDAFKHLTIDGINAIQRMIKLMVKKSNIDTDEEKVSAWMLKNSATLMGKVMEMCSPAKSRDESAREKYLKKKENDKSITTKE